MVQKIGWQGASGNNYVFDLLERGNVPSNAAGLYIFVRATQNAYFAEYIGQAGNLNTRLSGHEIWPAAQARGASQVHLMAWSGGEVARKNVESDLIARWNPPLNVQR